jgi:endonuclease/exonuclease/phosphatase family metal-dependent hydrolase
VWGDAVLFAIINIMKIISLNIWGGRGGKEKLLDFFKQHGDSADVFCLQEVWSAPHEHLEGAMAGGLPISHDDIMSYAFREISETLPDFEPLFHPHFGDNYGLMMLVHKRWVIRNSGEVFVYMHKGHYPSETDLGNHARNIQYVTLETEETPLTIINFHGLWNGKGKTDSEERLEQSDKILNFIEDLGHSVVFCGDFNLKPDTESLQKFEKAGLRNLISEYGITSTRTSHYTKPEKFADYAFTSPEIVVSDFRVLSDEVSDHSPLYIDIS